MTTADDYAVQIALKRGLLSADEMAADPERSVAALDPEKLGRAIAAEFSLPYVILDNVTVPADVLGTVPVAFAQEHQIMPYAREGGRLCVAVADPVALEVIDRVAYMAGAVVRVAVAPAQDIRKAIARCYQSQDAAAAEGFSPVDEIAAIAPASGEEGQESAGDAPTIRLVQAIITEAVRRRASDIHLEPLGPRFRVRYRIDGALLEVAAPPRRLQLAIISRLKIMANISIAEKRVPQDGRIQIAVDGRSLDLRVSSLPTAHGESIVMRILDKEGLKLGLSEVGLLPEDERQFAQQIASPDGIMLVTGPTGSGKSTTLYTALHQLNQPGRKLITVEEPVEYQIAGINQVPVNAAIGMTFAAALRAMLRQAPNIVMVGEVRDLETAEIALNAALTGHMVFSTLHTNDAPSAVTRLIDIGAKPFLVSAALRSVVAQRLVRRICPECKCAYTPAARELHALRLTPEQLAGATFAHGAGCDACQGTGYRGRLALFELLTVNDALRALIYDNVTAPRLRAQARRDGMRTLREDGIRKVLAGHTTIAEVVAVTVGDPL